MSAELTPQAVVDFAKLLDLFVDKVITYENALTVRPGEGTAADSMNATKARLIAAYTDALAAGTEITEKRVAELVSKSSNVEAVFLKGCLKTTEIVRDHYKFGVQMLATTFYKEDQHQDYARHILDTAPEAPSPPEADMGEAVATVVGDGVFWHRNVMSNWLPEGTMLYARPQVPSDTGEAIVDEGSKINEALQAAGLMLDPVPDGDGKWHYVVRPSTGEAVALSWGHFDNDDAYARSEIGIYFAHPDGTWCVRNGSRIKAGADLLSAKAAAQADYEKRIRSALARPQERVHYAEGVAATNIDRANDAEARGVGLVEALTTARNSIVSGFGPLTAIAKIDAALASLRLTLGDGK